MKKVILSISVLSVLFAASCKKDDNNTTPTTPTTNTEDTLGYELNADITSNRTLLAGKTYTMTSMVYVKNGATLTIGKGVTIKVSKGKNALVITRGAKVEAVGTVDSPVVFTSAETTPGYGDWGGIVMLGKAQTNASFNSVAGEGEIEGGVNNSSSDGLYGGSDDNDNSGTLKYVRIEYGGYPFQPDKELNSLTMGAVGRGTTIDYVECAYGYDDAFEWFGGTVNCKHLIAYKTLDDNFDADYGFRGSVQFGLAIVDPAQADVSGSNGFEVDNDGSGSNNTPFTAPVFANMTMVGPLATTTSTINSNFKRAAHLRRNSRASIFNSVLLGYPTGILVDGSKCGVNMTTGLMEIKGVTVAGISGKSFDTTGGNTVSFASGLENYLVTSNITWNNGKLTTTADAGLVAAFSTGAAFDPTPSASSVLTTGVATSSKLSGLTTVSYRGACAVGDTWWKTWSRF